MLENENSYLTWGKHVHMSCSLWGKPLCCWTIKGLSKDCHMTVCRMTVCRMTVCWRLSVDWPSVRWPSVEWPSVEWPSVEWPSVEWPSGKWLSGKWPSGEWPSGKWPSVECPNFADFFWNDLCFLYLRSRSSNGFTSLCFYLQPVCLQLIQLS